ncbi:unnamed protein product [Victoria cruziana]
MMAPQPLSVGALTLRIVKRLALLLCSFWIAYLVAIVLSTHPCGLSPRCLSSLHLAHRPILPESPPTETRHVVFGIASSARSWPRRRDYVRAWWRPGETRGFVWLDRPFNSSVRATDASLPTVRVSEDTSRFPYTYRKGLRSAIRVARIVVETVRLGLPDVRWFVFGDDDTVFFVDNLVRVLQKYDHEMWFYVGEASENVDQNRVNSFEMGFGGGGFAISYRLAAVLERVFDSCLVRYAHLYGSDARVFACLAELGVGLTHERGFHQVDFRGDAFGMLAAHPLAPLVTLHHLDILDPIFPKLSRLQALEHLFEAVKADSGRILQQTVCYEKSKAWTVSISWGYSVQIYDSIQLVPDLLPLLQTFMPWRRGQKNASSVLYMFNTRELPKNACNKPAIFFFEGVLAGETSIESNYSRRSAAGCHSNKFSPWDLKYVSVLSTLLDLDIKQLLAPRRQCCDIISLTNEVMNIKIRKCEEGEAVFGES